MRIRERRGLLTHPIASLGCPFWRRGTAPRQSVFVTDPKSFYGKKTEETDRSEGAALDRKKG
jgi:hypothetical protein